MGAIDGESSHDITKLEACEGGPCQVHIGNDAVIIDCEKEKISM